MSERVSEAAFSSQLSRVVNDGVPGFCRIVEISTVAIPGMKVSAMRSNKDQGQRRYSREVLWTPPSTAVGKHIFCFKAVDAIG